MSKLVELTARLRSMCTKPHIICVNETWLNKSVETVFLKDTLWLREGTDRTFPTEVVSLFLCKKEYPLWQLNWSNPLLQRGSGSCCTCRTALCYCAPGTAQEIQIGRAHV